MPSASSILSHRMFFFHVPAGCYLLLCHFAAWQQGAMLIASVQPVSHRVIFRPPERFPPNSFLSNMLIACLLASTVLLSSFLHGCSPRQRWNWTWQMSPEMEPNLTLQAPEPFWLKVHIGLLLQSRPFALLLLPCCNPWDFDTAAT